MSGVYHDSVEFASSVFNGLCVPRAVASGVIHSIPAKNKNRE